MCSNSVHIIQSNAKTQSKRTNITGRRVGVLVPFMLDIVDGSTHTHCTDFPFTLQAQIGFSGKLSQYGVELIQYGNILIRLPVTIAFVSYYFFLIHSFCMADRGIRLLFLSLSWQLFNLHMIIGENCLAGHSQISWNANAVRNGILCSSFLTLKHDI